MYSTNITSHPTLAQKRRRPPRAAHVGAWGLLANSAGLLGLGFTTKLSLILTTAAIINNAGSNGFVTSLAGTPAGLRFL
jgi:hypothetical protein